MDSLQVIPWSENEALSEMAIRRKLNSEELGYYSWANQPGDFYSEHTHPYNKVIYVVRGSITFNLPDMDKTVTINPGDRLELPSGIPHSALVGPEGVTCLEAHL